MTNLWGADLGVPALLDGESGAVRKFPPSFIAGDCERSVLALPPLRLGLPTDEVDEPTDPRREISAVDDDKLAAHLIVW